MSAYDNDRRVTPHPDGTFIVYDDHFTEFNVAPLRIPGTWEFSGTWGAFDTHGRPLDVDEGDFDEVVHALIGDPR